MENIQWKLVYDTGHPKPALRDSCGGKGRREVGGGLRSEGTYVCLWLIHVDIWQNNHNTVIILPLK